MYVCRTSKYLKYIPTIHKGTDGGIVTKVSVKLAARFSEIKSIEPGNKTKQNDNPTQLLALQALCLLKLRVLMGKSLLFTLSYFKQMETLLV